MKNIYPDENNVVLNENSVEGKPFIIDKVRAMSSQFIYTWFSFNTVFIQNNIVFIWIDIFHII